MGVGVGGWGRGGIGGQLLMLSPGMPKSQIPINWGVGGWVGWQPTFDAESRNAKIPNSNLGRGVEGRVVGDQLLMLSPEILTSQIPMVGG